MFVNTHVTACVNVLAIYTVHLLYLPGPVNAGGNLLVLEPAPATRDEPGESPLNGLLEEMLVVTEELVCDEVRFRERKGLVLTIGEGSELVGRVEDRLVGDLVVLGCVKGDTGVVVSSSCFLDLVIAFVIFALFFLDLVFTGAGSF